MWLRNYDRLVIRTDLNPQPQICSYCRPSYQHYDHRSVTSTESHTFYIILSDSTLIVSIIANFGSVSQISDQNYRLVTKSSYTELIRKKKSIN